MDLQPRTIHSHTPTLIVIDPRSLAVRSTDYYFAGPSDTAEARVNRTVQDSAGRAIAQWDSRLFQDPSASANLSTIYALSGTVLLTRSVDAGARVGLFDEAGQAVHSWDGRDSQRWMQYDNRLRLTALFEQEAEGEAICSERLSYGASDQATAEHNQCGQLIRHDEPAGVQLIAEFGLLGGVLEQTRHFLNDLATPDWPESIADRQRLLEPGEGATSRSHSNALGEVIDHTDAKGNRQFFSQTLDGQLREVRLQLAHHSALTTLVSAINYNAHGQTEREVAGNGVITLLQYGLDDGRLIRLQAHRGNETLQDLRYEYDPVGNVLSIEDAALPIRYFANQRIEPISHYRYDSLYQLIEATGWEVGGANKGPQFSTFDDPAPRANYRQRYHYDAGGNLLELIHEGPQSHGHRLLAARHSNRCLPVLDGVEPGEQDFINGFDANGNLLNLQPGQTLRWDVRNQLSEVRPVERASERYIYGADGMRVRKVRLAQTNARMLISEVRYLPNLELRSHSGTGEVLQVISVRAGRSSVRVLHWESAPPKDSANDQYRYSLNDHLGSCALELDNKGEVISQERYHPFGTTAWFAGRGEVEASYKTVRYSGKERDATGLYYYGFRYYIPWLQRWGSADPAGSLDGINLYRMVKSNPVTHFDILGLSTFAELFEFFRKEGFEAPYKMAVELDRYIVRQDEISYEQSYFQRGGKEVISLRWTESDIYKINDGELARLGNYEAGVAVPGLYSSGFIGDLARANNYTISKGHGGNSGFEISFAPLKTIEERLRVFENKVPDADNRARISEVAFQSHLAVTARSAHVHVDKIRYYFLPGHNVKHNIILNDDESVTVRSSNSYKVLSIEADGFVEGIHLEATVETRVGSVDGKLQHGVLEGNNSVACFELSYERDTSSSGPSPNSSSNKGFSSFFNFKRK